MTAERPDDPTAEQFRDWIKPFDALTPLHAIGLDAATGEIYRRLRRGMLWAAGSVGETASFRGPDDPRSVIPALWWEHAPAIAGPNHIFWRTGGLTLTVPTTTATAASFNTYEHFGVRFEPEGLQRMADDVGVVVHLTKTRRLAALLMAAPSQPEVDAAPRAPPPPKVTLGELVRWAKPFGEANRDATFAVFLKNARTHFRNRRVTERPMRDAIAKLGMTKSRGNPTITRK